MIKRIRVILIAFVVLLMSCFLVIGYAAISDNLYVTGEVSVEGRPYKGVYIKSVEIVGSSGANNSQCEYILPTNHKTTVDASKNNGSVTYKITVHNNTDLTYWYIGTKYDTSYEGNKSIGAYNGISIKTMDRNGDSAATFNTDDWVPPQTERVFYVTYTYGSNAQSECTTLVNFKFDIRMDAVYDEFLAVLQYRDLEDCEELLKHLDAVCANTLIKETGAPISIASGFAMFEADRDRCLNDVFKRADNAMYENKRKIKGDQK